MDGHFLYDTFGFKRLYYSIEMSTPKTFCSICKQDISIKYLPKHIKSKKHVNNMPVEKTYDCYMCGRYHMNLLDFEQHIKSIPHNINANEWGDSDSDT